MLFISQIWRDNNREFMERGNSRSVSDRSLIRKHGVDSIDRISDLADSILGHILSFLPTKDAVATHILSQRLILGSVLQSLGMCTSFLYMFRLLDYRFKLRSVFSCEGLRSLELACEICISPEIVVSLPRLECLKLISVYFQSKEAFSKLVGGCPVLKDLYIDVDIAEMMKYLHLDRNDGVVFEYMVSSTSLRRLEIYARDAPLVLENTLLCNVHLDAPSLEYVKLDGQISSIFILQKSLTSLVEADIQLAYLASVSEKENYCNSVVESISAFDYARTLTLSAQVIQALSCATTKMRTTFDKLRRLDLKIDWNHWSSLQDFIELSDNLEVLTIRKDYYLCGDHINNSNWKNPKVIPRCLSSSLKTFSMEAYDGHQDELEMLGYILKNGRVLEDLRIRFGESIDGLKTKREEFGKILELPKSPSICSTHYLYN